MAIEQQIASAAVAVASEGSLGNGPIAAVIASVAAAALAIARYAPRLGLERRKDSIETDLYDRLSKRIETMAAEFDAVKQDRDRLFLENADLRLRVHSLESIEMENTRLRERLAQRELQNERLLEELLKKQSDYSNLQERFHQLELRVTQNEQPAQAAENATSQEVNGDH